MIYYDPTGHRQDRVGDYIFDYDTGKVYFGEAPNPVLEGFKDAFFKDTVTGIKNNFTNFFSNPVEYTKDYFVNRALKIEYTRQNFADGFSNRDYYKVYKGLASISDAAMEMSSGSGFLLDNLEKAEEIKQAYDDRDINKLKYMQGQNYGDLGEIGVTALITGGITKGIGIIKGASPKFNRVSTPKFNKQYVLDNLAKTREANKASTFSRYADFDKGIRTKVKGNNGSVSSRPKFNFAKARQEGIKKIEARGGVVEDTSNMSSTMNPNKINFMQDTISNKTGDYTVLNNANTFAEILQKYLNLTQSEFGRMDEEKSGHLTIGD